MRSKKLERWWKLAFSRRRRRRRLLFQIGGVLCNEHRIGVSQVERRSKAVKRAENLNLRRLLAATNQPDMSGARRVSAEHIFAVGERNDRANGGRCVQLERFEQRALRQATIVARSTNTRKQTFAASQIAIMPRSLPEIMSAAAHAKQSADTAPEFRCAV